MSDQLGHSSGSGLMAQNRQLAQKNTDVARPQGGHQARSGSVVTSPIIGDQSGQKQQKQPIIAVPPPRGTVLANGRDSRPPIQMSGLSAQHPPPKPPVAQPSKGSQPQPTIHSMLAWETKMKLKYQGDRRLREDWELTLHAEFHETWGNDVPDRYKLPAVQEVLGALLYNEGPPQDTQQIFMRNSVSVQEVSDDSIDVSEDESLRDSDMEYDPSQDLFEGYNSIQGKSNGTTSAKQQEVQPRDIANGQKSTQGSGTLPSRDLQAQVTSQHSDGFSSSPMRLSGLPQETETQAVESLNVNREQVQFDEASREEEAFVQLAQRRSSSPNPRYGTGHTASLHRTPSSKGSVRRPSNEGSVRHIPIHQDKGHIDVSGADAEGSGGFSSSHPYGFPQTVRDNAPPLTSQVSVPQRSSTRDHMYGNQDRPVTAHTQKGYSSHTSRREASSLSSRRLDHSPPARGADEQPPPSKRSRTLEEGEIPPSSGGHLPSYKDIMRPEVKSTRQKKPEDSSDTGPLPQFYNAESYKRAYPLGFYFCRGEDDPMSNFYYADLVIDNVLFKAGECRYVDTKYRKVGLDKEADELFRTCRTARQAQRAGKLKNVTLRRQWLPHRLGEQVVIFQHKWIQNKEFAATLKSCRGKIIVHDVPDEFWGTFHYENGHQVQGGSNMYGKLLMAFLDVMMPEFAADLYKLPQDLREEMRELKSLIEAHLRPENRIATPPVKLINELPPLPNSAYVTVLLGDSIFNDGRERESRNMVLLSLARDLLGPNVYVSAFPGSTTSDMQRFAVEGRSMHKLPRSIKDAQIKDIVLGFGVNDLLKLLSGGKFQRLSRDQREQRVLDIVQRYVETVRVLEFSFPEAHLHISQVIDHPRLLNLNLGAETRKDLMEGVARKLQFKCSIFVPKIPKDAWANKENDGLHLSVKGKLSYARQLAVHFRCLQSFRT